MSVTKQELMEAFSEALEKRPPTKEHAVVKTEQSLADIVTKVATAISLALLLWVGQSVAKITTQQAVIIKEQTNQKEDFAELKETVNEGTRDRYPRTSALDDHAEIVERVLTLKSDLRTLETRVNTIEKQVAVRAATE